MNGRVLLDTNAIIYGLNAGLIFPNAEYCISIITEMELFAYAKLTPVDRENITNLLTHFTIFNIDDGVKNKTIEIRINHGVKLPDSIICATSIVHQATLISNDKQLSKVKELNILTLEKWLG